MESEKGLEIEGCVMHRITYTTPPTRTIAKETIYRKNTFSVPIGPPITLHNPQGIAKLWFNCSQYSRILRSFFWFMALSSTPESYF